MAAVSRGLLSRITHFLSIRSLTPSSSSSQSLLHSSLFLARRFSSDAGSLDGNESDSILWVDDKIVSQVKTVEKEGIFALQIGCGHKKPKHLTMPELGNFRAQGVPLKRKLREFPVMEDALLPVGTELGVRHFVLGQYVDVTGITRGKGFQRTNGETRT